MNAGAWFKGHKTETLLGAGGIVVTIALYVRQKNAASATNASTASTTEPTAVDDTTGTDAYNGIEDQVLGLQQAILGLSTTAGGVTMAGVNPGGTAQNLTGASTPAQSVATGLPWVGPGSLPDNITTAMVTPGEFEEVGTETNGQYSGAQVAGGVPLFGQFGTGFFQNFGLKGGPSPDYTGPVFAPSVDSEYVNYGGPITGAPG